MTKFVGLRAKTYSYLIDDGTEDKKAKGTKKCVIKRKLEFENYNNCLEVTQLDNKINYLVKNNINIESLKRNHKQFTRNNKSILKTQQIFKSERHVFIEKINQIALGTNDDKRMQPIYSIEKHEDVERKYFNDIKAFIEYSNDMGDIYKSIEEHNSNNNVKY